MAVKKKHFLIIEDSPDHLKSAREAVNAFPEIQFTFAGTAAEALKILRNNDSEVDFVLSDILFPLVGENQTIDADLKGHLGRYVDRGFTRSETFKIPSGAKSKHLPKDAKGLEKIDEHESQSIAWAYAKPCEPQARSAAAVFIESYNLGIPLINVTDLGHHAKNVDPYTTFYRYRALGRHDLGVRRQIIEDMTLRVDLYRDGGRIFHAVVDALDDRAEPSKPWRQCVDFALIVLTLRQNLGSFDKVYARINELTRKDFRDQSTETNGHDSFCHILQRLQAATESNLHKKPKRPKQKARGAKKSAVPEDGSIK